MKWKTEIGNGLFHPDEESGKELMKSSGWEHEDKDEKETEYQRKGFPWSLMECDREGKGMKRWYSAGVHAW